MYCVDLHIYRVAVSGAVSKRWFDPVFHLVLVSVDVSSCRAMFLSEMSEAKQNLIEIKDFDGDAIQDLVHFAYSSKLTLTVDNVQPLLYAACILQVNTHTYT